MHYGVAYIDLTRLALPAVVTHLDLNHAPICMMLPVLTRYPLLYLHSDAHLDLKHALHV